MDPLAPFVGADEERAGGPGQDRPVPRVAGGEPPRLAGHLHPVHLGGDHVEVADHERHDLDEQLGQPEPPSEGGTETAAAEPEAAEEAFPDAPPDEDGEL